MPQAPLWRCPECGERFVSPRMPHSCGRFSYEALFARCDSHVREIFDRLAGLARRRGPVRVYPQKTRAVMQVRMRFLAVYPRKSAILAGFVVPTGTASTRFEKVEYYGSRHYVVGTVRLRTVDDVDAEIRRLMKLAYGIGEQRHLKQ
ncbi:MAG TPA: hypothetical protein VFO19_05250 [Vicinamibacterales bacterium]|nr:hypothetical protein [Vicinamibacterales bacterium]